MYIYSLIQFLSFFAGPQLALSGWGGAYEASVIIHKSPWDPANGDMQSYYTALLGYDQAYTLVGVTESMRC
jgi:hypothetical protein